MFFKALAMALMFYMPFKFPKDLSSTQEIHEHCEEVAVKFVKKRRYERIDLKYRKAKYNAKGHSKLLCFDHWRKISHLKGLQMKRLDFQILIMFYIYL